MIRTKYYYKIIVIFSTLQVFLAIYTVTQGALTGPQEFAQSGAFLIAIAITGFGLNRYLSSKRNNSSKDDHLSCRFADIRNQINLINERSNYTADFEWRTNRLYYRAASSKGSERKAHLQKLRLETRKNSENVLTSRHWYRRSQVKINKSLHELEERIRREDKFSDAFFWLELIHLWLGTVIWGFGEDLHAEARELSASWWI